MSNRGYSNSYGSMRPNYQQANYGNNDRDRYYNQGHNNYDNNRPEYYDRNQDKNSGYRGSSGAGYNNYYNNYDERVFKPWDQSYR